MSFDNEDKNNTTASTRATVGVSVNVKGEISGDEDILIEGSVEGSINLKKNAVFVAKTGKVRANINGVTIHVEGDVTGDLVGSEQVIVHRSGKVRGNITAPRISIEDGAKIRGQLNTEMEGAESTVERDISKLAQRVEATTSAVTSELAKRSTTVNGQATKLTEVVRGNSN
jgi:cytoskeletal protein CcmA (bactofilin family)